MTDTSKAILALLAERGPMTAMELTYATESWLYPVAGALVNLEGMRHVEEIDRTWQITDAGRAALALWFAYYNYCRRHMTLKETPAQATGLEDHRWTIRELIEESAKG